MHPLRSCKRWLFVLLLAIPMGAPVAQSDYPSRALTITTPTAAGGGTDLVARIFAERLTGLLGQSIVIDNKSGAGGLIGNQAMQKERNDGYSLFVSANNNQLIVPLMFKDADFDPIDDYEPVAGLARVPYILAVHPSFPAGNLKEFLAEISNNPGKYQYVSAGVGTLNHLIPEMLSQRLNADLEHVPYKGIAAALSDVVSNRVPIVFGALPAISPQVESGRLKLLAVTSETRLPSLPSVPALNEEVPGLANEMWVALWAPAGTSDDIVSRLDAAVAEAKKDSGLQERISSAGMSVMEEDAQGLNQLQKGEFEVWKKLLAELDLIAR